MRYRCNTIVFISILIFIFIFALLFPSSSSLPPLPCVSQQPEQTCGSVNGVGETISVPCGTWSTWWKQVGGYVQIFKLRTSTAWLLLSA